MYYYCFSEYSVRAILVVREITVAFTNTVVVSIATVRLDSG